MAGPGAVDQIIANRYRLREMIGRGGMGCVWSAEHVSLRTPVAIKLLRPEVAQRPEWQVRFLREAQAAAELRSRHVVHILDHGIDDGLPYLAMEFLRGESLQAYLKTKGALSADETAIIMRGILRAISRAHRAGIVHRDLKPDNVFLAIDEDSSDPWLVKVLDFGIAKLMEERAGEGDVATGTGVTLGTPFYMSPEQTMGLKDLDARSDLWSLGAIAFECLTGRRPFEADAIGGIVLKICSQPIPVPSDVATVPLGFDAWFARANQREPKNRFQTAHAFAAALAEVLSPGQRWLEVRSDEPGALAPTTPPQTASASAVLGEAPTERKALPGETTGQVASRSIISYAPASKAAPGRGGRYALFALGAVAVVAVVGLGVSRGPAAGESAAARPIPEPAASGSPSSGASSVSPPLITPTSPPAPSASEAAAATPSASAAAPSGSAAAPPSGAPPSKALPPSLPPKGPARSAAPHPPPAPAASVNLGI